MDRAIGSVTYTQMLNTRGGIECDFTVTAWRMTVS
jgi:4-methylaminobutanoate oxidase (formaldehyde-forming)